MTTWNHRIFKQENEHGIWYSIREVYYDDKGIPITCTVDEMAPNGETVDELRKTLERMIKCLDNPVLTDADFVGNEDQI